LNNIGREFLEKTRYQFLEKSAQKKGIKQPPLELEYNKEQKKISLPEPGNIVINDINLKDCIEQRRSVRNYSKEPVSLEELSFLLWITQGIRNIIPEKVTFRNVPSAGARHAFETFLLINRVAELKPGLYRYLALEHNLLEINTKPEISENVTEGCLGQKFVKKSAVTFIWVAITERMNWRYGNNNDYLKLAQRAADFILSNLYQDNTLFHRYRKGAASVAANLDDYAFLIWGLIELYQATFKPFYLERALEFQKTINNSFWDAENGGYYFTPERKEDLIVRIKEIYDGAVPSGNSITLWNLVRLSHLSGNQKFIDFAEKTIKTFSKTVAFSPASYSFFLIGLSSLLYPYYDLVIVGDDNNKKTKEVLDFLRKNYLPNLVITLKSYQNKEEISKIVDFLNHYQEVDNQTTLYLCKDYSCSPPVSTLEELITLLE
jgi:SagB-type dehydrogenase family enzyme